VLNFLINSQEQTAEYFNKLDLWYHGYWRMQEAHHGTEHFELFLGYMTRISPGNTTTIHQLTDAVEHIGNWSPNVPRWFDYESGLFRSLFFGTDGIRPDEFELNMPDHLRCANLLLLAYDITYEKKYLDLAKSYTRKWAIEISNLDHPIPIGFTRDGPLYSLTESLESIYRSFAGMAGNLGSNLDRAENILASGGLQLFLKLWEFDHDDVFLQSAQRLLTELATELTDPDAGPVADAIRFYRRLTGRHDFDQYILNVFEQLSPFDIQSISVDLPKVLNKRPTGVGKRADMPIWYEDSCLRRHNPILISVAAEILDSSDLYTCAVDLARTYFKLAVQLMPDGRHHGCAARTVSAIARGHGRNNHAGMTTAVLHPVMQSLNLV
jgi:hypothetical protein